MAIQRSGVWNYMKSAAKGGGGMVAVANVGIEYAMRKNEGASTASALGHGAIEAFKWYAFEPIMMAKMGVDMLGGGFKLLNTMGQENLQRIGLSPGKAHLGGHYQDTDQAYTLRQRNLQAIQESRLNARSVLGNEARMLHR